MGKIATNLIVVLGFITVAFAGYYVFIQQEGTSLSFNSNEQTMENMLSNTRVFIEHRQFLSKINLNTSVAFFDDARFRALRSFSTPIKDRQVGRENPFETAVVPSESELTI
jgi:hypothetical protein